MLNHLILSAILVATLALTGEAQPSRWSLEPRPTLTIGSDEGDAGVNLQVVVYASRLPDGGVVIGDRGDFSLLFFGPDGKPRKSVARKGSGPGEVVFLGRMWRCGDSLFTYDIEARRVSAFTLSGEYVRQFRFGAPAGQQVPYLSACNRAGEFVHLGWERVADAVGGAFRSSVPVWMSGASDVAGPIIDSVKGSERWGTVVENRLRGTRPLPLGKQPVLGIGRAQLYVGSADRFEVRALNRRGEQVAVLRKNIAPVSVSAADIKAFTEREIANGGERNRARIEASLAAITFPATLPAYTHLVVDAEDMVWVRGFPRGRATTAVWTVFDPTGAVDSEVEVPTHLEVFEIGADYLLGRYLDPDEAIPQVRIYKLRRTSR